MFVQNDKLRMGGSGASGSRDLATITNLRGTWIRIVTRINMTSSGPFEVWVNGMKTASVPINLVVGGDPPTIRWANGMYCTAWRTQQPAGGSPISVWHDHFRVATTYDEAEPANWGHPSLVDAGAADGPTARDAAISDARAGDSGSAGADGGSGSGGSEGAGGAGAAGGGGGAGGNGAGGSAGGAGGASGGAGAGGAATGGRSGTGGSAGATAGSGGTDREGEAPRPSRTQSGCACAVGARGPAPSGPVLLVLPFAAAVVVRRRTRRAKSGQPPWQQRLGP
jgi:hypothetical protein